MAIPADRQAARELIQQIFKSHLDEEQLQKSGLEDRRVLKETFFNWSHSAGLAVIVLARDLYTSPARFIHELLRNADNNVYTKAASSNAVPSVSFYVYPSRIIVDCNEDGFTADDLKAICSVGVSANARAQGCIRETSIGFKAVFKAAWKAHIQSGPFSFSFTHRRGESGMGMISPVWEDAEQLKTPLTRIILHLYETGDEDTSISTRDIEEQFNELHETLLLFMKNLREIHVRRYQTDNETTPETTVSYCMERPRANYAILKRTTFSAGTTQEHISYFHVTTHQATNLARNDNKKNLETGESTPACSKTQVTLAFPLSEADVPIIHPQYLFVFLPVLAVGFNFIIQADFVIEPSRQDIVEYSPRNKRLLDVTADAFAETVRQFLNHDTLRYRWMRYLPPRTDGNVNSFWRSLIDKIAGRVNDDRVLYCHQENNLHLIRDLVRLQNCHYADGQPLFDDGSTEQIVSKRYDSADLNILHNYGLRWASGFEISKWLRQDLGRGTSGRWKSPSTVDSWHTQAARVLLDLFKYGSFIKEVMQMDVIPLRNGTWLSPASARFYFAQVNGLNIPPEINLRIVAKDTTNTEMKSLFKKLGARTASVPLVRRKILERYSEHGDPTDIDLETSKSHLEFLYLTQHLRDSDEPSYARLSVQDQEGLHARPYYEYIYIASTNHPYGALELFSETAPGSGPGDGAPGYPVAFVDPEYFFPRPETLFYQGFTWVEWFWDYLHVEEYVVFSSKDSTSWEGAAEYLRKHRPEKFLGCLNLHYLIHDSKPSRDFVQCVQNTDVLCRDNGRRVLLKEAYIPEPSLEKLVETFVEPNAFFPWLWLDPTFPYDWKDMFMAYSAGFAEDLVFALHMLQCSLDALPANTHLTPPSRTRLFKLYNHIQVKYGKAGDMVSAKEKIRTMFTQRNCIYIPSTGKRPNWAPLKDCVWNAPDMMRTKFVLRPFYLPIFSMDQIEFVYLKTFLTETLGIGDCTWQNYVHELRELRRSGDGDLDTITAMYQRLRALKTMIMPTEKEAFRAIFEDDGLIFLPSDDRPTWHKTSQCVWSTAAILNGGVSLHSAYRDLQDFFVDVLGVRHVKLQVAIDELSELGSRKSGIPIREVKNSIFTVNSLLLSEAKRPSPSKVLEHRIFPIRYPGGNVECHSKKTSFFIVDRNPLKTAFESKVKLLDFTVDEVVRLGPFFKWTGLDGRYISDHVKKTTSLDVSGAKLLVDPTGDIQSRAHAILRTAFYLDSPRTESHQARANLYTALRSVRIYETGGLTSDLHLAQDGQSHMVEARPLSLHFGGDETNLKIYVPIDQDPQKYMLTIELPATLYRWLMKHPNSQIQEDVDESDITAVMVIMLAPLSLLPSVLESCGITGVDIENVDEGVEHGSVSSEFVTDPEPIDNSASSEETTQQDNPNGLARNSTFSIPIHPKPSNNPFQSLSRSSPIPSELTPPGQLQADSSFAELLTEVIAAGRRDTIPNHTDLTADHLQEIPFDKGHDFEIRGTTQFEKDCKLGATGELYVFELLSHLTPELPGFSTDNWQSNMREYVTVHPEYANMGPWIGRETSDITYNDVNGVLTQTLIDRGYLHPQIWSGKRPCYYIEVKTTSKSCSTAFLMSKAQSERMRKNILGAGNTDTISTIFRVYNLGRADRSVGLKIYIDPETLRWKDRLDFTALSWSVVPSLKGV